ncbi:FMN-binding protein [Micromonospora sp. C28SCA-DRY-2]|uniref:FMN-binding protein n=1 Tax=Micromonospora sp. C28SCA-DRY-2 TaxID=3059522 RepID=UPI0026751E3B|nr:FMN-binding protein [Micromonospora sp. C28SCA-DRY-2]MDO3701761.1 FMN-binding protein [Micromonospora sp. C28SCA-DRY-2]
MRRALLAITGLAASTTAMVVLKGGPDTTQVAAQGLPVDGRPVAPGAGSAPPEATAGARPTPAGGTASPRPTRTTARPPASRPGAGTRTPSAPRTSSRPAQPSTRTVTGPVVENEYGNVQVQITLSGSRIVNVVALELPAETAQSDQRSEQVDDRYSGTGGLVVQQQSADLDTVSGATATSESYRRSLQAALDRAG